MSIFSHKLTYIFLLFCLTEKYFATKVCWSDLHCLYILPSKLKYHNENSQLSFSIIKITITEVKGGRGGREINIYFPSLFHSQLSSLPLTPGPHTMAATTALLDHKQCCYIYFEIKFYNYTITFNYKKLALIT